MGCCARGRLNLGLCMGQGGGSSVQFSSRSLTCGSGWGRGGMDNERNRQQEGKAELLKRV